MTLAAQQGNAQTSGSVGINIDTTNTAHKTAALNIAAFPAGHYGLYIAPADTADINANSVHPLVAGQIVQHTDGNYYKYDGTQRVAFGGPQGPQ